MLRALDFNAPATDTGFSGDGELTTDNDRVQWLSRRRRQPQLQATIDHLRGNVHDARITDSWAVLTGRPVSRRQNARPQERPG